MTTIRQDLGYALRTLRKGPGFAADGIGTLALGISALLYGVEPRDPMTLVSVPAVLAAVAMAACFFPGRRASRVDPITALRSE